jgi:hypothetical protein
MRPQLFDQVFIVLRPRVRVGSCREVEEVCGFGGDSARWCWFVEAGATLAAATGVEGAGRFCW